MFTVRTEIKFNRGILHALTRKVADRVLDATEAFYRSHQGQIPYKTGRLRASLVNRGAPDNIAQVVDGPRGPVAEYGTHVPYAKYPNVKRKIPKPNAAALIATASQP